MRLHVAARRSEDAGQVAARVGAGGIYDGASRTEAAAIGGVTLQVVRDWVLRFNARGLDGLIDRRAPGKPPLLDKAHRAALAAVIESGPVPAVHGMVRWRIIDQMLAPRDFAPGNAGVPFYTGIICPLLAIVLLFASKPSEA